MKKSGLANGQKVYVSHPNGGIDIGEVEVVDNNKVQRNGKPAVLVKDDTNKKGYVKTKYISEIKPKRNKK